MAIEDDELVDPDPEVPEMGLGEDDEVLMPKNSKDSGFEEPDPEDGLKESEKEAEEEEI